MITKTNFQLLRSVMDIKFEERGFCTDKEVEEIADKLQLKEMNELQLRNIRDLTVIWSRVGEPSDDKFDLMSAVTSIIDDKLFQLGKVV